MPALALTPASYGADLARAAAWLRDGGIVAFPTETFYGLAVDPASAAAVASIFDLKGRGSRAALPVIAPSIEVLVERCGPLDAGTATLARAFWPGPLSVLVTAPAWVADAVHAGTGALAVRVPAHRTARDLAAAAGGLVTATSANRSGEPPASRVADLAGIAGDPRVLVLDGGPTAGGAPSTIVDARSRPPRCLREGAIAWERVVQSLHA